MNIHFYTGKYIDGYPPPEKILSRYENQFFDKIGNTITEKEYLKYQKQKILSKKYKIKLIKKGYRSEQLLIRKKIAVSNLLNSIQTLVIAPAAKKIAENKANQVSLALKNSGNTKKNLEVLQKNEKIWDGCSQKQLCCTLHTAHLKGKGAQGKKNKKNLEDIIAILWRALERKGCTYTTMEEVAGGYANMSDTEKRELKKLKELE